MPIYEYRCAHGQVVELVRSMADEIPAAVACVCLVEPDEHPASRVFGIAAAHYKGPGFYETDYRGRYNRRRRKNPGDDLTIPAEAAITRAEGAEYDPPRRLPAEIRRQA